MSVKNNKIMKSFILIECHLSPQMKNKKSPTIIMDRIEEKVYMDCNQPEKV